MTRIASGSPNPAALGELANALIHSQTQVEERAPVAQKQPARTEAPAAQLDAPKSEFLKELRAGLTHSALGAEATAGATASVSVPDAAIEAFSLLANTLTEPKPGQVMGKQFAREAAAAAAVAPSNLTSAQLSTGGALLSVPMNTPFAQSEKLAVVRQFTAFFDKLATRAQNSNPAAPTPPTPDEKELEAKLKESGVFSQIANEMSEGTGKLVPSQKDFVAAIDAKEQGAQSQAETAATTSESGSTSKTDAVASSGTANISGLDGLFNNLVEMDIAQAVQLVFFQMGRDADNDVRDLLKEMNDNMVQKSQLNGLMNQYKKQQTAVNRQIEQEYKTLVAEGKIGKGHTLEEYKSWRMISWSEPKTDAAGNMTLGQVQTADPFPPDLPMYLRKDANPTEATEGAKKTKADGSKSDDPCVLYGIPQSVKEALFKIWQKLPAGAKPGLDGGVASFNEWLEGSVGLSETSDIDGVRSNAAAVSTFLDTQLGSTLGQNATKYDNASQAAYDNAEYYLGYIQTMMDAIGADSNKSGYTSVVDNLTHYVDEMMKQFTGANAVYINSSDQKNLRCQLTSMMGQVDSLGLPSTEASKLKAKLQQSLNYLKTYDGDQAGRKLTVPSDETYQPAPSGSEFTALINQAKAGLAGIPTGGVGQAELGEAMKDSVATLLGSYSPPLPNELKQQLQTLLDTYDPTFPEDFFGALQSLFTKAEFRQGGPYNGFTEAVINLADSGGGAAQNDEMHDRLRGYIYGDDSKIDLTNYEKSLIEDGVIEDPREAAKAQKEAITDKIAAEKEAAEAESAGKVGQRTRPGDSNLGYLDDLQGAIDGIKTKVDAVADVGQMMSLRLQIYMERRSKAAEMLSSLLKKMSDVDNNIVGNFK